ncbi:hypothetical protein BGY98DRAFT_988801 [Russula aff. rugulosa BPL654]|nr:hypothetical protein BGY98DRAFT_988801 [Russula aff. rugulosa BPL654]
MYICVFSHYNFGSSSLRLSFVSNLSLIFRLSLLSLSSSSHKLCIHILFRAPSPRTHINMSIHGRVAIYRLSHWHQGIGLEAFGGYNLDFLFTIWMCLYVRIPFFWWTGVYILAHAMHM